MNPLRSLSPGMVRVISLAIVASATVVAFVLLRPHAPPSSFTIDARHTELELADRPDVATTGTFATEKLLVTSTAADAIVSSGGAQIGGQTIIAASTTSSATAERLLLKSTNAGNDRSSIQWVDSANVHKWAMGNNIAFDPTEASFFVYDWVNNFYPILVRDGTSAGRRSHFIGGVPGDNGGIAFERGTDILSLVINHPGGSGGGGDRLNLDVNSVLKGPDYAQFAWASSTAITDPTDLAIGRSVAGVAEINNGTPGTLRALSASTFYATGGVGGPSWQSGAGSPEGVITAPGGSLYSDTTTFALWIKQSAGGNTGWAVASSGAATGTGTANTVTKWTGVSTVGDSQITDDGTTVAVGGTDLSIDTSANTLDWRGGFITFLSDGSITLGSNGGVPLTRLAIDAATGNVTMNNGDFLVSSGSVTATTGAFTGTLTADGGNRVFDVAGDGMTSSTNTVNVVAAAGGGLTANANDLQMTFCAANQVPTMNGAGTAWGCATPTTGTITGTGTANTMAKFTGASAIGNSTITDDGTTVAVDTTKFTVDVTTGNTVVLGTLTADGGNRVFDVAGAGLTSSTNTVNAIAAVGGGITVNADSIQMTFCAANQIPQMNAGGTAWGCAAAASGTIGGSITASGVVYASGANTAATDETAFQYYAAGDILNIGSTAVTNCGAGACSGITLAVTSGTSGAVPVYSWNTNTAGYSGYAWNNSSSVQQGSMGFANSTVGVVGLRGLNFLSSQSADYVFYETTSGAGAGSTIARFFMTSGSAGLQLANGSSGAVGAASTGKLIYNSTTNTFRASLNGGAFTDVITGAVAANTIPKSASSTTGALTASTITDNGTTVSTTVAFTATSVRTNGASGPQWTGGSGAPAASCTVGDMYSRTNGTASTTLYVCGATNTWSALATSTWGSGTPTTSANCTLTTGGRDAGGRVTLSSGTDCTLTFGETAPATPLCQMYDCSAAFNVVMRNPSTAGTTSATWTATLDTSAAGWCYKCSGGRNSF